MSEAPTSLPSVSPKRRNQLVSSLVGRISPKNNQQRCLRMNTYDRIVDEDPDHGMSLTGGERTSPCRATAERSVFCIDSDDESCDGEDSTQERKQPPKLPSLLPLESIPANYICPLTLQVMEDPVQDSCGHTFERRAIMECLDRSNQHEAVCPISRKPLLPLGFDRMSDKRTRCSDSSNDLESNHPLTNSCCYDRVLKRNEGLQKRIQEWKLSHPLYQGVDEHYAQRYRRKMIRHNTIEINDSNGDSTNIQHSNTRHASIDCPYGGDIINNSNNSGKRDSGRNGRDTSHHSLSRFELMLLPQEREAMKIMKERKRQEQEQLNRSHRCVVLISILISILFLIGFHLVAKGTTMDTIVDGER